MRDAAEIENEQVREVFFFVSQVQSMRPHKFADGKNPNNQRLASQTEENLTAENKMISATLCIISLLRPYTTHSEKSFRFFNSHLPF